MTTALSSVMAHTLWSVLLSESKQIYLLRNAVSLTEFVLQEDIKNLSFIRSWNQAPWVLAGLKSQLDTTEWLSIVQSPCHVGLNPNLRQTVSNYSVQKWKDEDLPNTF